MNSQNQEEHYITSYFGDYCGSLLSIGENDGVTFSNAFGLIRRGWSATLIEPSPIAFKKLSKLHEGNPNVTCLNIAIGSSCGKATLYESGHHLKNKSDYALLSSLDNKETERWRKAGVVFTKREVIMLDYKTMKLGNPSPFDFISIDAEGYDLIILEQIDLKGTQLLCIEWNLDPVVKEKICSYCSAYGLSKILYESPENLVIAR